MAAITDDKLREYLGENNAYTVEVGKRLQNGQREIVDRIDESDARTAEIGSRLASRQDEIADKIDDSTASIHRHIDKTKDTLDMTDIIIGIVLGVIAALIMWNTQKDVIVRCVLDKVGNVVSTEPNIALLVFLSVAAGAVVAFIAQDIVHAIRNRH